MNDQSRQVDRIMGMIFGHALGSAVGIAGKYSMKKNCPKIAYPRAESVRGYPLNDWSADTDRMILVMQAMTNSREISVADISRRLKNWVEHGDGSPISCDDERAVGVSPLLKMYVDNKQFLIDPTHVADDTWQKSGKKMITNLCLSWTPILGADTDTIRVKTNSRILASTTHSDPKCSAACTMHAICTHALIYRADDTPSCEWLNSLLADMVANGRERLSAGESDELAIWLQSAYTGGIADLELDQPPIDHVFKALGCSVFAMQIINCAIRYNVVPSFKKIITHIASEGGDADINCALIGAVIGAYIGYSALPSDWIEALPAREWLAEQAQKLLDNCNVCQG